MTSEELQVTTPPEGRKRFGRYTLLYKFAAGGMANLYVAKLDGADGFEKRVAIKVIHEHLISDPEFVKMFIDEARIASRISHPNVVQTIELGRFGKTHFMAMEYVDGESLTSVLRRTRPTPAFCARVIADVAAGLHAAHELRGQDGELLNVVHRDVSPQNILISYDGAVKVVDFGVARARGRLHTTSGGVKGKVSYMAPEQIDAPATVDRRADVFALGIVLWEATTRTRLVKGDNEGEKMAQLLACDFPLPSSKVEGYPAPLEQIVMRALSRDPDDRFATTQEVQEALEQYIVSSGVPVLQANVANLMREVFADRIAKKKRLDAESNTESSTVFEANLVSLPTRPPPAPPRRRTGMVIALVVSGLMLAAATAAVVLAYRSGQVQASSPTWLDAGAPPDTAVVALAPDQQRPALVRIAIRATPKNATIRFRDRAVENPFVLETPASPGEVDAVISAPRHHTERIRVPLSTGGEWNVTLKRRQRQISTPTKGGKKPIDLKDEDVFNNPYSRSKKR